jgi:hypothetical protein
VTAHFRIDPALDLVSSGKVSVRLVLLLGLAMVNMPVPEASGAREIFDIIYTSTQLWVSSFQVYCPSGIGTGASHKQVSSFSTHEA